MSVEGLAIARLSLCFLEPLIVERAVEPVDDLGKGRPGCEHPRNALVAQFVDVLVGDDTSSEYHDSVEATGLELSHDGREHGAVSPGKRREADCVDILLERDLGNRLWRLAQTRIDDLKSGVSQCHCDDFGTPIVAIESRLGDQNSAARKGRHGAACSA